MKSKYLLELQIISGDKEELQIPNVGSVIKGTFVEYLVYREQCLFGM